jgi:hypothetical protein
MIATSKVCLHECKLFFIPINSFILNQFPI